MALVQGKRYSNSKLGKEQKDSTGTARPIIAPNMGQLENSTRIFQQPKAAYVRGGDTEPTRNLEAGCIEYLGRYDGAGNAPYALCANSGHSANVVVLQTLSGGSLVASKHLFGTTKAYLKEIHAGEAGNNVAMVNPWDTQGFINETLANSNVTAWFVEAVSNPTGMVPDFEALSKAAKEMNVVLVADMTLAAGMPNFEALKYADVLTTSLTKQAGGGENLVVGGSIIVNGNFNWHDHIENFPQIAQRLKNDAGSAANPFGEAAAKNSVIRGPGTISPRDAITVTEAFPTMQKRVRKMSRNARIAADQLSEYSNVAKVQLAGYKTELQNDARMQKYMGDNGFVLVVDMKDPKVAEAIVDRGHFPNAVALGQAFGENSVATVSHPATSTHRQYSPDELAAAGFGPASIRVSVGAGGKNDVKKGFERAFSA